ncbi:hypothetical protein DFH06DRAFT_1325849 [Mycena polygramma]|nr:hypothetical protein DFH06DRAFT_1325849 [Mycena polygramma]
MSLRSSALLAPTVVSLPSLPPCRPAADGTRHHRRYAPLPDETVILAFAKALFPRNRVALLDVIRMSVFPGDPTADTYQDVMPNLTVPVLQALGHVSGPEHKLSGPTASRAFLVTIGDYIFNSNQTCDVEYDAP